VVALRFGETLGQLWFRLSAAKHCLIVVLLSTIVVAGTGPLYAGASHGQPLPFVSYLGLLSGLSVAHPLEIRWVDFDPRSSSVLHKLTRVALGVCLIMGTLLALDPLFAAMATDGSVVGNALRYLRYFAAGFVGMFAAPYLFVRLRLAEVAR